MSKDGSGFNAPKLRGGRLFKWKGQIVSAAPAAMLAQVSMIALAAGIVHADTISNVVTTPQVTSSDVDHEVTSSGASRDYFYHCSGSYDRYGLFEHSYK